MEVDEERHYKAGESYEGGERGKVGHLSLSKRVERHSGRLRPSQVYGYYNIAEK
jgi:hypothetical protein